MTPEKIRELLREGKLIPVRTLVTNKPAKEVLEAMGIKVLGQLPRQPLYQVELPQGWTVKFNTYCCEWEVFDANGNERLQLGWYEDRMDSCVMLFERFIVLVDGNSREDYTRHVVIDRIDGKRETIYATEYAYAPRKTNKECGPTIINVSDEEILIWRQQEAECEKWLDNNYPSWRNPAAYWDT